MRGSRPPHQARGPAAGSDGMGVLASSARNAPGTRRCARRPLACQYWITHRVKLCDPASEEKFCCAPESGLTFGRCLVPRFAVASLSVERVVGAVRRPDGVILATPKQMHAEEGLQCIAGRNSRIGGSANLCVQTQPD